MNILMVTMQYGYAYTQGTERYVAMLSECLRERGHQVTILGGDPLGTRPKAQLGNPVPGEPNMLAYPTRGWMSIQGLPPKQLDTLLRRICPDIVHLNTPAHVGIGIMAACKRVGIPCIVTVHDYWWVCPKGTLLQPDGAICDGRPGWSTCIRCLAADHPRRWVRRLANLTSVVSPLLLKMYCTRAMFRGMSIPDMWRWLYRRKYLIRQLDLANYIVFPSKAIAQVTAAYLSHRRWRVIPNGLTRIWFDNPRVDNSEAKPPEALTIGYSGALAAHKAPHLLLDAVRLLGWKRTHVRLAGSPADIAYDSRLRQAAEGLSVEFVGRLTADEMPAFLRSLDMLAMTSVWPENCPYSVLEAQAAGVAVVGSRAGGVVEMISDKRLLFEPGSSEGLAAAIDFARKNPQAGRSAKPSTAEQMTDAVEEIYRVCKGGTQTTKDRGKMTTQHENFAGHSCDANDRSQSES